VNRELIVFMDRGGQPVRCGRLWTRSAPREDASFEYDAEWRMRRDAFAIDPELPIDETDTTASMELALQVAPRFAVSHREARELARRGGNCGSHLAKGCCKVGNQAKGARSHAERVRARRLAAGVAIGARSISAKGREFWRHSG
jgi:hypothetical protein